MKLATLYLPDTIRWNLTPNDPQCVRLESLAGSHIINPLVPLELPCRLDADADIIPLSSERCHVLVRQISLLIPDNVPSPSDIPEKVIAFLRTLRLISKQAVLPTSLMGIGHGAEELEIESLPQIEFPRMTWKGSVFGKYRLETALTMDLVLVADQHGLTPDIPICHEILLDALGACERDNHREAILYAAFAMESIARTALETEYEKIVGADPPPPHSNVLAFPVAGGGFERKDPIYKLLSEGDNFARLLHEAPLYLLRRSLLQDDQTLYQRAIKLYRTRNKLSHGKRLDQGDGSLLFPDRSGAYQSLQTAIEVFRWFGVTGYLLPKMNQVPVGN